MGAARPARCGPTVNERDELGSDLVPDYMTSVQDGGFYGWPYSYYGQHVDSARRSRSGPTWSRRRSCPTTRWAPTRPRSASPSRAARCCPSAFATAPFVGQHGSWNRKPRSGYKVIFVPFADGKPSGAPVDVLTGFVERRTARRMGRPVGVAIDRDGALLVADDVGNTIWRVGPAAAKSAMRP